MEKKQILVLWIVVIALTVAIMGVGAVIVRHEIKLNAALVRLDSRKTESNKDEEQKQAEKGKPSPTSEGGVFTEQEIDGVRNGQAAWLEDFLNQNAVDPDTAEQVRTVIVTNMRKVNALKIMEFKKAMKTEEALAQIANEFVRRKRVLVELLGVQLGQRLDDVVIQKIGDRVAE